jgi:hypothetical protein
LAHAEGTSHRPDYRLEAGVADQLARFLGDDNVNGRLRRQCTQSHLPPDEGWALDEALRLIKG